MAFEGLRVFDDVQDVLVAAYDPHVFSGAKETGASRLNLTEYG